MNQHEPNASPSEDRRKEIFQQLVDSQDQKMSVQESRKLIAERFSISDDVVRQIDREGLDHGWPPL